MLVDRCFRVIGEPELPRVDDYEVRPENDARRQFIEGLEQYVAGIETDERLLRLARNVSAYHDQMPAEACRLLKAILETRDAVFGSYAVAALDASTASSRSAI